MINKLKVKNVSTYDGNGIEMNNLKKVNFIYGNNGSGKTTITEVIRFPKTYTDCELVWNEKEIHTVVYNRNFIEENFRQHMTIKGIFTLGKESTELLTKIDEKKQVIKQHDTALEKLDTKIDEFKDHKKNQKEIFEKICWEVKAKYDADFKELFGGFRGSKDKFSQKCLEIAEIDGALSTLEELKRRKDSLYDSNKTKIEKFKEINFNHEVESPQIFKTKIIGKEDLQIATLISSLNISDWVKQGHTHLNESEGICPFCQQEISEKFVKELNEYFDDTFRKQLTELQTAIELYKNEVTSLLATIRALKETTISYLDKDKVDKAIEVIEAIYNENKLILKQKLSEPSRLVTIEMIGTPISDLNEEIGKANQEIERYNNLIDNVEQEKKTLNKDFWYFIAQENQANYITYKKNSESLQKKLSGIEISKEKKEGHKREHENELREYQEKIISIEHSINEINRLLKSFGFTNFKLAQSKEKGNYEIIRNDGERANETLSEGEKTFVTFLYFYQLIKGSNSKDSLNNNKIVIIDDPISSLDSNVLFIVSNLIRQLVNEIRTNTSDIKQIFIFTHNVYFHKEVSFNKGKGTKKLEDETFWILRKTDNITCLENYRENPIKTSYELLWKELSSAKNGGNVVTIQNIMRRILENYFKFFGNLEIDKQIEEFSDEDKVVCHSMMSWLHDGSHYINEDLFIENPHGISSKYFSVFEKIFENSGHHSHYKMMMGEELVITGPLTS